MEHTSAIPQRRPGWHLPSWPLLRFIVRRFFALIGLALGMTLIAFTLTELVPGNPTAANLGPIGQSEPAVVAAFRHHYGLDKPLPVQYLLYLDHLIHGDLGVSEQTQNPVLTDLKQFAPATAELALASILIATVVGVALGIVAAMRRNRLGDHVIRIASIGSISIPTFWLGLIALYVFFFRLNWFPGGGRLAPGLLPPTHITGMYTVDAPLTGNWSTLWNALHHLVLPAIVLSLFNLGLFARYTRSAVLEVIDEDYVRAARAKGLPERIVMRRHVLRAALNSVITLIGLAFANVLTGAVIVETIFNWAGIGQYAYHSAVALDLPAVMGSSLFIAVVYILINFLVDILYGVVDPRIRVTG